MNLLSAKRSWRPAGRVRFPSLSAGSLLLPVMIFACGGASGDDPAPVETVPGQETADGVQLGADGQLIRVETVTIGGVQITVEIADTQQLRQLGLMNRDSLPENHGMLFVYPDEQIRSFWMRNTRIPLDIAFIDRNLTIVNIEQMEPQTDENTFSVSPVQYALEMDLGWFEANGVGVGDRLEF